MWKIQIVIMDEKDYIIEYKDFSPKDRDGINIFIWEHIAKLGSYKIHIRKWKN